MERSQIAPAVPPIVVIARCILGVALVVFGVQHFLYAKFVSNLITAWIPFRLFWAYFVGVAFFAAALSFFSGKVVRLAGFFLGLMFVIFVVFEHAPRIAMRLHEPNDWTSGLIALAMAGAGWMLGRLSSADRHGPLDSLMCSGRYLFAVAMLGFGIQHGIVARTAAGIGPPWFPHGPLSASVVALILLLAGIAGLAGIQLRIAGLVLAATLLLLFVAIHIPRMLPNLHDPRPWTSAFEIFALCGAALLFAASTSRSS